MFFVVHSRAAVCCSIRGVHAPLDLQAIHLATPARIDHVRGPSLLSVGGKSDSLVCIIVQS